VRLGWRTALEGRPGTLADDASPRRWLGLLEGTLGPSQVRGEVKDVDPILLMLTIDGSCTGSDRRRLYRRMLARPRRSGARGARP
jgi:hypothetical protein